MKITILNMACAVGLLLPSLPAVATAQIELPGIESTFGPAVAQLGNTTYIAWTGILEQPEGLGYKVWYRTLSASSGTFLNVYTTAPLALTQARGTVYLAIRGNAPLPQPDNIYYSSLNTALDLQSPTTTLPGAAASGGPALTGDASTLYAAWSTSTGAIEYAAYTGPSNAGSWSTPASTPALTTPGRRPAIALFNNMLFFAWVSPGTSLLEYATLNLTSGLWSTPEPIGADVVSGVAPALGVYGLPGSGGVLYIAYTYNGYINLRTYDTAGEYWVPGPPPGPLTNEVTPALLNAVIPCGPGYVGGTGGLENFYTSGSDGQAYYIELVNAGLCKPLKGPPPKS